ncbi:hypothetical protein [Endozoicomonas sp. ALB032]|uniref:hypothetical protein n=1 Tax=Endozoicomonas sp. ALB032 TaxID=3403082 RepID=UPI003BB6A752
MHGTVQSPFFLNTRHIPLLQNALLSWFSQHGINYPWRQTSINLFQLVITECLLQRTRAETVATYWPQFFNEVQNWETLITIDKERLAELLTPFGLVQARTRNLQALAWEILDRDECLPHTPEALMELPGVGHYIANAIRLLVFEEPVPLLDVNFARVIERLYGPRRMADIRCDPKLKHLAECIVNSPSARELNWAVLDLAKTTCTANRPHCEACPLSSYCLFYNNSRKGTARK